MQCACLHGFSQLRPYSQWAQPIRSHPAFRSSRLVVISVCALQWGSRKLTTETGFQLQNRHFPKATACVVTGIARLAIAITLAIAEIIGVLTDWPSITSVNILGGKRQRKGPREIYQRPALRQLLIISSPRRPGTWRAPWGHTCGGQTTGTAELLDYRVLYAGPGGLKELC